MVPERLDFLKRLDKFYNLLTEGVKTETITEGDFYLTLACKCKSMNRERLRRGNPKI